MSPESKERAKKLVSVLVTSTLVTRIREKAVETAEADGKDGEQSEGEYSENLVHIPCIWNPVICRKKSMPVLALFDLGSEVNAIHPTFVWELGLLIQPTDVSAQKIDSTTLNTFEMVVAAFFGNC